MSILRKIIFYLFLTIYVISCPFTILSALGYVVKPGARHGIMKTGVIALSTLPAEATIYVEQRRYTQRTPTVIRDLLPGDYHLKLILRDHEPWDRIVHVVAEKATVLDHILLLREHLEPQERLADAFEELIPIPDTRFLLLAKGATLADLVVYDWQREDSRPFLSTRSLFRNGQLAWQVHVRSSPFLLLGVRLPEGERVIRAELKTGETSLVDLTHLFPSKPIWVEWGSRAPRHLFTVQEGAVNRLDVDAMAMYPKIAERVRGYGVSGTTLYVLTDDLVLQRVDQSGKSVELPFDDPVNARSLFGATGQFQMTELSENLVLFLGERGELLLNRVPYGLVEHGVRGFVFDPAHQRLLVWQKDRLGVVDLSSAGREDAIAEHGPFIHWVFQDGRDITQGFWVYHGSHALFHDQQTVLLLELGTPGTPALQRVVQVRPSSPVAYSEESGTLYYLDPQTGRLSSLELLSRKVLPALPFPEHQDDRQPVEAPVE